MAENVGSLGWIGPVAGAIILVGGYIGYQQWHEQDQHQKQCAALVRSFSSNTDAMTGPLHSAIAESERQGTQAPMASMAGFAAVGDGLMSTLDAQCPDWKIGKYR